MTYKMIDYQGQGFVVMGTHDFDRWRDNLSRRFDDSAEAGNLHLHVRVNGEDRTFTSVDEYLSEFTVRDINDEEAKVLARLFAIDKDVHHAWYGQHDMFRPFAGK
ncbi:hypothetical protein EHF33_02415 [Deinococcus psychrotolerans]|uniref:Uncharacterized protein n=1 Tax=Deinococcus psychrotolerans TaxID=2489213 RepID=A0A3G8YJV0_9DEIO|nr:hypothetical protein [Deinococcus psychrotolerans]AZI41741.1 hypothetical protein EHF33_02415 [Deinococcus psychrotolerans]